MIENEADQSLGFDPILDANASLVSDSQKNHSNAQPAMDYMDQKFSESMRDIVLSQSLGKSEDGMSQV